MRGSPGPRGHERKGGRGKGGYLQHMRAYRSTSMILSDHENLRAHAHLRSVEVNRLRFRSLEPVKRTHAAGRGRREKGRASDRVRSVRFPCVGSRCEAQGGEGESSEGGGNEGGSRGEWGGGVQVWDRPWDGLIHCNEGGRRFEESGDGEVGDLPNRREQCTVHGVRPCNNQ